MKHSQLKYTIFLFIASISSIFAQERPVNSLQLGTGVGQIFRHTTNFKPPVRGLTSLTDLSCEWQTTGSQAWHNTYNYPIIGLSLSYADFGDPEIFGQAIGILPSMTFTNRWKNKRIYSFLRIGFGVAYLTKPYNSLDNQLNNVIGSHWNNITDARGGVGFRLTPQWDLLAGASFTHFSNGSAQYPNLGLNVPAPMFALRFTPNSNTKYTENQYIMPSLRWHGLFSLHYAVREAIALGGPKYAMLAGNLGAMYELNRKHNLYAQVEYEFSEAMYKWAKNQSPVFLDDESSYLAASSRYAIAVGDEFRFGQFGFSMTLGFYLPGSASTPLFMYEKLGWRYYFLPKNRLQPFLNAHMKAHDISAEYISFGAGVKF